jgi:hypothetical protein
MEQLKEWGLKFNKKINEIKCWGKKLKNKIKKTMRTKTE